MATALIRCAQNGELFIASTHELEQLYRVSDRVVGAGRRAIPEDDWYTLVEQHFYLALLTCRDNEARLMLQLIMDKVGTDSVRVSVLRADYAECTEGQAALDRFRGGLDPELASPVLEKRELAHIKLQGKWQEYVNKLCDYVDSHPTDAETWAELAEAYAFSGCYGIAVEALERLLVLVAFAYPVFARIGELKHLQASAMLEGVDMALQHLRDAVASFCRSVELCPNYVRGWSGVFVVTTKLVQWPKTPEREVYEGLNKKAQKVLESLVDNQIGRPEDIAAAKALLS